MGTTAFADECKAKGFHFLVTVIDDGEIARVRSVVGAWRAPGSRSFHASQESPARRRRALEDVAGLDLRHVLIEVDGPARQYIRRQAGVATIVEFCGRVGVSRLVLDLDETNLKRDRKTIIERGVAVSGTHGVSYAHLSRHQEPLLWVPDLVVWAWIRGGPWRAAVRLEEVIRVSA
jgi:hypothetical protein